MNELDEQLVAIEEDEEYPVLITIKEMEELEKFRDENPDCDISHVIDGILDQT